MDPLFFSPPLPGVSGEPSLRGQAAARRARDPAAAAGQGPAHPQPGAARRRPPALPELPGHAGGQRLGGAARQPPAPGSLRPALQPRSLPDHGLGDHLRRGRGERSGAAAHQPAAHPPDAAEEQRAAWPHRPQGEGVQGPGAHLRAGEGPQEEQRLQERCRREESAADPQVEVQGAEGGAEAGGGGREEEAGGGEPKTTRRRQRE